MAETLDKLGIPAAPNKARSCVGTPRTGKIFSVRTIFLAARLTAGEMSGPVGDAYMHRGIICLSKRPVS